MNYRLRKGAAALLAAGCILGAAAREAATFFVEAPPSVLNIYDKNGRLDMLDYFRSGLSTPTSNILGGKSRVVALEPDLVSTMVSENTRLDLAVLRVKGDTIIALIETVSTPVPDSSIRLYKRNWEALPAPALPTSTDFADKKLRKRLADDVPAIDFITAEYIPGKGVFLFTNHTAYYYFAGEVPELLQQADSTLTMRYDGKRFVPAR